MLFLGNGDTFATGVADYDFRPVTTRGVNPRILLRIEVGGVPDIAAMDTGAPFFIIAPNLSNRLDLDPNNNLGDAVVWIRGTPFHGYLERIDIHLPAHRGNSLSFEATAFIINAEDADKYDDLPSMLGIGSCLERIRFAIDPSQESQMFYFGELQ